MRRLLVVWEICHMWKGNHFGEEVCNGVRPVKLRARQVGIRRLALLAYQIVDVVEFVVGHSHQNILAPGFASPGKWGTPRIDFGRGVIRRRIASFGGAEIHTVAPESCGRSKAAQASSRVEKWLRGSLCWRCRRRGKAPATQKQRARFQRQLASTLLSLYFLLHLQPYRATLDLWRFTTDA